MVTRLSLLLLLASVAQAAEPSLPPRDVTCAKDTDCDSDWTYLVDGKCCDGTCSPQPASKRYLELVSKQCKVLGFAPDCGTKKCAGPPPVKCVKSRCVFVP